VAEFDAWHAPALGSAPFETVVLRAPSHGRGGGGIDLRYPALDEAAGSGLIRRLREARRNLLDRPIAEIAECLGSVGRRFLDEDDPLRARALELLPRTAGVSGPMAAVVLDGMAADWTPERLRMLLEAEFGEATVVDRYVRREGRGRTRALGPPFAIHLASGSVPGVSVTSLIRSLLVKTAVLLKPGRGDVVLPVLFAEALTSLDPDLGSAVSVVYWPGGDEAGWGTTLLAGADLVVVYGADTTVEAVRRRLPAHVPLVAYHHRAGVALVGRAALTRSDLPTTASDVARAVATFDQRGCVCPRVVWVEEGGEVSPRVFAEAVARAMEALEDTLPSGWLELEEASALQQRRGTAELLAASGADVGVWSGGPLPWTVVLEGGSTTRVGDGPGRFVRVRAIEDASGIAPVLKPLAPHLQTVAVAGLGDRVEAIAEELAFDGALRITPMSHAPWPPPWWHHDGRGPLQALSRWVDLEGA